MNTGAIQILMSSTKQALTILRDASYGQHILLIYDDLGTLREMYCDYALEKLNNMKKEGVDKYTTIQFDSSKPWQRALYKDTSAANGLPTIAHFIKRAFLISENDPYNRLYQFIGQGEIKRSHLV